MSGGEDDMDHEQALWSRLSQPEAASPDVMRLQEMDGGFFEKFGKLTKDEKSEEEEEEDAGEDRKIMEEEDINEEEKEQLISDFMGLNIDELYAEVLYEIVHMVGSDAETLDKTELFDYLREAFKLEQDKHQQLLRAAQKKEAPKIFLNVEVIEAKDLKPKDPNGLSDPFCTLYLTSSPTHRYHTCVKPETLNPSWEEHFYMPVQSTTKDSLCIEVWDFDPAETIKEKVTKISGVKGVKGLGKLMKEIAVTASTGKHDNEIIGVSHIPLTSIPSSGQTKWAQLEKKPKSTSQGVVKLKVAFSSQKNKLVACQEYRHILRLLLLHEFDINKTEPQSWDGEFNNIPTTILRQHASQSGMQQYNEDMAEWIEFTRLHSNHQLNFRIYSHLLENITPSIRADRFTEDEVKMFWEGAKKLLPSLYSYIKSIKKLNPKDKANMEQTVAVLEILSRLNRMKYPEALEMFHEDSYGWITNKEDQDHTIKSVLIEAITQATEEWFDQGLQQSSQVIDGSSENDLKQAIKVSNLARSDLQKAVEYYDKLFVEKLGVEYAKHLYTLYEERVCSFVEPLVNKVCSALRPIRIRNDSSENSTADSDSVAMGTSLFELYLSLQRFSILGVGLFGDDSKTFKIAKFHDWFYHGVAKWLDIAVYKAIARIDKAIDLDTLIPVDSSVKYSSSAVDTLSIFYQIKVFWTQLSWPDVEGSYTFVAKILDDLCRCCVYFADGMGRKVGTDWSNSIDPNSNVFQVTNEWCLAVNNIDYVKQSIQPFAKDLGVNLILEKLSNYRNQSTADNCGHTIKILVENTVDIMGNKVIDLLEIVSRKMQPTVKKMLLEGTDYQDDPFQTIDKLLQYLDENLMTLHSQLNTVNFQRILSILWYQLLGIFSEILNETLEKKKPPQAFANLGKAIDTLVGFFRDGDKSLNTEMIADIKETIQIYSMDTNELIHKYYMERLSYQRSIPQSEFGVLAVTAAFTGNVLKIEVLNARNLFPHDSNGSCDPFVKLILLPKENFPNQIHLRTKTHKKSLFPLFDESFTIEIEEDKVNSDSLIQFMVKDQDFLYFNQFAGEAFIPFSDIPHLEADSTEVQKQIHLTLTKPLPDSSVMKVLDARQGDRKAKDFIKKQKNKMILKCEKTKS